MGRARSIAGKGKGWHSQTKRHSRARRTGRAGGKYASKQTLKKAYGTTSKSAIKYMKGKEDVITGKPLKISKEVRESVEGKKNVWVKDSDKDGVPDKDDCAPFNPKKTGWLHDKSMKFLKKLEEKKERKREAEMRKLEDLRDELKHKNVLTQKDVSTKQAKLNEKQAIINEVNREKLQARELADEHKRIKTELSKNRADKKIMRASKKAFDKTRDFLQKPSTQKAIKKGRKAITKELKRVF